LKTNLISRFRPEVQELQSVEQILPVILNASGMEIAARQNNRALCLRGLTHFDLEFFPSARARSWPGSTEIKKVKKRGHNVKTPWK
jgi:hypothetical protein